MGSNSSPVAERGSYDGGVTVGEYPLGVAVDPRTGWVYVANSVGNSVSILNGSTLLTTVGVGSAPFGVAYDPYYGWVYVTDSGSGQVSVLNGTRVIQTITVQSTPEGIAVDPGTGEAYVAEASTNNVTVLSGQSVVTNLAAGMGPDGVAYSSWNGDFYVADNVGNTVTVLNGTSRVAVIRVGAGPGGIAFDAVNGYTYVTNLQAGNVSAIYGVNFIQNVSVQLGPDGVAIDGANGLAYVTNQANNSVSVINVTSNIGTIGAGTDPHGAAYDPANGMIYVADYGSDSVSMISTVLGIAPPIVTDRGNDVAASDVNQTLTVTADLWGPGSGTDLLSEYLHPSKGFGCGPTPNLTATGTTWIVSLQCTPASPGVYSLWLNVTDGDRSKVWSTVTVPVDPALLLPPPNFTSLYLDGVAVADVNQSVGMLADPSGGSGVYVSFAWSGLSGRPCQSVATARPTCRFPSVGLYEIGVEVTDSNQAVVQSLNSPLQIDPLPFVGKPSANRSSADVNEPVRFSESVSGGAGSLNYVWTGFGGQRCSGLSSASPVCAFVAPGTYNLSVTVGDSVGSLVSSPRLSFEVLPLPNLATPVASRSFLDVGQTVTLTTVATGGFGNYTFVWTGLPPVCAQAKTSQTTCTATAPGTWTIWPEVIDGNGGIVASNVTLTIPVYPDPTVAAPTLSASTLTLGSPLILSAPVSGGTGNYSYNWSGLPPGCSGRGETIHCTPSDVGSYSVSVEVRDSSGLSVRSEPSNVTVKGTSFLPTWLPVSVFAGLVVLAALLTVLAGAILVRRRRRARSGPSAELDRPATSDIEGPGADEEPPPPDVP